MNNRKSQKGLVMITMLLIVFMAGTSMFFVAFSNKSGDIQKQIVKTKELFRVKETLLSFAASYPDIIDPEIGPGRFPCPDRRYDNDETNGLPLKEWGETHNNCNNPHQLLGKLPRYMTLDDGSDFRFSDFYEDDLHFWYSVSSIYRSHRNQGTVVNSDTASDLSLDGDAGYVAIIIAPGAELSSAGQDRSRKDIEGNWNWNDSEHYLEYDNQDQEQWNQVTDFISAYPDDPENFNDQVIGITRDELMTRITPRVIREIKNQLDATYAGSYPADKTEFDTSMNAASVVDWYANDQWSNVITYNRPSANSITIAFDNCDIEYSLNHNGAESIVSKSENNC